MSKGKVVVGMSGGVDSSVAAWLLKEQGYDVIGVTMQIWQDEENEVQEENGGCCGLSAVDDARRVASSIGIPYYVMNFKQEFQKSVIDYFTKEYLNGRTPNPCIACNRYVKWEALLQRSLSIGADYIATGHYARIDKLSNGRYAIRRSATLRPCVKLPKRSRMPQLSAVTMPPCLPNTPNQVTSCFLTRRTFRFPNTRISSAIRRNSSRSQTIHGLQLNSPVCIRWDAIFC